MKPLFPDWAVELDVASRQLGGAVAEHPDSTDATQHVALGSAFADAAVPARIAASLADVFGLAVLLVLLAGVLALGAVLGTAAVLQGDQARRPENAR